MHVNCSHVHSSIHIYRIIIYCIVATFLHRLCLHRAITSVPNARPCFTRIGIHSVACIPIHVYWDTETAQTQPLCPNMTSMWVHGPNSPRVSLETCSCTHPHPHRCHIGTHSSCVPVAMNGTAGMGIHAIPVHPLSVTHCPVLGMDVIARVNKAIQWDHGEPSNRKSGHTRKIGKRNFEDLQKAQKNRSDCSDLND